MRNIILFTGGFASGKTELIAHTMLAMQQRGIAFLPEIISDSHFLTEVVNVDHSQFGGVHHVHENGAQPRKHARQPDEIEYRTFQSVSPLMQREMFRRFFWELGNAPNGGKYVSAELGAGVNRSPAGSLAALNDYSYWSIVDGLQNGLLDLRWIDRVAAVIHIKSDYELRKKLNDDRLGKEYHQGDDVSGEASRPLPEPVMLFTADSVFII